jgi:hypothetical protein
MAATGRLPPANSKKFSTVNSMRCSRLAETRNGGALDDQVFFAALPRVRARLGELCAAPRNSQTTAKLYSTVVRRRRARRG